MSSACTPFRRKGGGGRESNREKIAFLGLKNGRFLMSLVEIEADAVVGALADAVVGALAHAVESRLCEGSNL